MDSSPTALGRRTRSANATVSPTRAITGGDVSTIALVHADPSSPLFEGQPQGTGTIRGPPPPTPAPGLASPGRPDAVTIAANLVALQQQELRLAAAIKEQERLENVRRAEDVATLRREIEEEEDEEDETDAAIENQRLRLEKAVSVRFVDTE